MGGDSSTAGRPDGSGNNPLKFELVSDLKVRLLLDHRLQGFVVGLIVEMRYVVVELMEEVPLLVVVDQAVGVIKHPDPVVDPRLM